ncbi:MAG: cupredoxin family copper-binding protein [Pseudomonadota bacterium]
MLTKRVFIAAIAAVALSSTHAMAAGHAKQVRIAGFAFGPAELTVSVGDTITFLNGDGAPHTATATDGSFDTGRLNSGDSATVTITSAGTYEYVCSFHPSMKGVIIAE